MSGSYSWNQIFSFFPQVDLPPVKHVGCLNWLESDKLAAVLKSIPPEWNCNEAEADAILNYVETLKSRLMDDLK